MSDAVLIALIGLATSVLTAIITGVVAILLFVLNRKTDGIHKLINSNLAVQIDASKSAAHEQGREEGRLTARAEAKEDANP